MKISKEDLIDELASIHHGAYLSTLENPESEEANNVLEWLDSLLVKIREDEIR